jgi:hypothetical protein
MLSVVMVAMSPVVKKICVDVRSRRRRPVMSMTMGHSLNLATFISISYRANAAQREHTVAVVFFALLSGVGMRGFDSQQWHGPERQAM